MPIYEYQCDNCDHKLECIQKISDDPLLTCPKCDQDSLRKLVSAASFRLKGTGWYATDFRDKAKKTESKDAAQGGEKKEKPADKPESKPSESGDSGKKEAGGSS